MRQVEQNFIVEDILLAFPDVPTMADFIIANEVSAVQIDSRTSTVYGSLSVAAVTDAVINYSAIQVNPDWHAPIHSAGLYKYLFENDLE